MKRIVAFTIGSVAIVLVLAFVLLRFLFYTPDPPQPVFGFAGDWRSTSVFGFEERRLPPAKEVWRDYTSWYPATNQHAMRLYTAALGGIENQSSFRSNVISGDTPMGAQRYTMVEFIYTDPTNGTYHLNWNLRGVHDTRFLQFDGTYRLYQLQLFGSPDDYPPKLSIVGIEGIRPEHYQRP